MSNIEFFEALTRFRGSKEPLLTTTTVLSYEVGSMLQQAFYAQKLPAEAIARLGFFDSELIDAIAQLVLICESRGKDFEEMKKLGVEKALERFTRKERK